MIKFKIERGITPPRRGPKPRIDYTDIPLEEMKPGDSVKITEVPKTRRNSTYLTVVGALKTRMDALGGDFKVTTTLVGEDRVEVRIWKQEKKPDKE